MLNNFDFGALLKVEKSQTRRTLDYEITLPRGGMNIIFDKIMPGAKIIESVLDHFVKKDLGTAEIDPDLEKKL